MIIIIFFYYKGMKIISLNTLYKLKSNRGEKPKDARDCKTIKKIMNGNQFGQLKKYSKPKKNYKNLLIYRVLRKIYRMTIKKEK